MRPLVESSTSCILFSVWKWRCLLVVFSQACKLLVHLSAHVLVAVEDAFDLGVVVQYLLESHTVLG